MQQHLFEDGAQAAGAGAAQQRLLGDGLEGVVGELELDVLELEELPVLLEERVLGFGEDPDERVLVEVGDRTDDGEAADELGDQTELEEVLGEHVAEEVAEVLLVGAADVGTEADALAPDAALDDAVEAGEGAAADEQDVRRVDLDELLVGVLAPPLGRDRCGGPLQDLQQGLLHALAGHVAGDRGVLGLAGDLVDLVDVDDPGLGLLDVVVGGLDQLEEDVLDVLADVARLGEGGGVGDGERDVQHAGEGLRQEGLAAAGGPDEEDVRLRQLDLVAVGVGAAELDALVVVVDGDREDLLRLVLADDVVLQEGEDLRRLGQLVEAELTRLGELLLDDLVAQVDALVADVDARSCDELLHLLLGLATERALQQLAPLAELGHLSPSVLVLVPCPYRSAVIGPLWSASSRALMTSSMMPYSLAWSASRT